MPFEIVRIDQFGVPTSGLRNIRCAIDGRRAVFDLVPERVLPPDPAKADHPDPMIRRLTEGASLVVEGPMALRLEFWRVLGLAADSDSDVDLFGGLQGDWSSNPRLNDSQTFFYPLLEIRSSPWKALLPEWRGRDDADIRHIRMISAECSYDVLGELGAGTWIDSRAE